MYLYSLFPNESKASDHLGGWQSMGKVLVEGDSRKRLVAAFKAATENKTSPALCFEPHHGIRIRGISGEQDMDLVICFTCRQFEVHLQGDETQTYTIDESAWPLFNALLKAAMLPYEEKR